MAGRAWYLGNTTVRSPYRLKDGLRVLVNSPLHGHLEGRDNEQAFAVLLHQAGIVAASRLAQDAEADVSDLGRKWRAALMQLGFITNVPSPDLAVQSWTPYVVTEHGKHLLESDTPRAEQEVFLRSLSTQQLPSQLEPVYAREHPIFNPLRLVLKTMAALKAAGSDEYLSFDEFRLYVQVMTVEQDVATGVSQILDLRTRLAAGAGYKETVRDAADVQAALVTRQSVDTLRDYADANLRYLKATGLFTAHGRGIAIADQRHTLVEQLLARPFQPLPEDVYLRVYWQGGPLPTDQEAEAISAVHAVAGVLSSKGHPTNLRDLKGVPVSEINRIRYQLDEQLDQIEERVYAEQQLGNREEILAFLRELQSSRSHQGVSIPTDMRPAFLEWAVWRAFLAIDSLVSEPWQSRRFNLDPTDHTPISTAPGGGPDLLMEFAEFVLVVEVTLTSSSRQEAAEGEPVRRHVADAVRKYSAQDKPVFGLFIANAIDNNTAETLRIGSWYYSDTERISVRIVPFTLQQFIELFDAGTLEATRRLDPSVLRNLLLTCLADRTADAPQWKGIIDEFVTSTVLRLRSPA